MNRSWSLLAAGMLVMSSVASTVAASPDPSPPASGSGASPDRAFGATWQSVSCDELDINEKAAAIADCGYVTVPENRAAGTDSTIQLGVVRLRSTNDTPGAPVFVGTGGPGGPGLDFLSTGNFAAGFDWASIWAPVLADRDIVRFTQRGTQLAKPFLACPEYDAIDYQRAVEGWTREEIDARIETALTACRDRFATEGVDFSAYNSDENAADIVDIKDALGYDTITYYGESYGTLLGQYLLRNHPEVLESIILDGIAPATPTFYSQMSDIPAAFQRIYDACEAQATCKAQYGDLAATVEQLVTSVDEAPVQATVTAADGTEQALTLTSKNVLDYLLMKLYSGGTDFPQSADGMLKNLSTYVSDVAPKPSGGGFARIQHFAINCSDDANASMEEFELDKKPAYLQDFLYDDGVREVLACQVLQVPQLGEASDALVESDLPALLLNGGLDPATAASNGEVVAKGLPNSQYVLFPSGGHVQSTDPCAVGIIAAFLKDPTAAVDTSCITPAGQLAALTPTTFKNEDGSASLTLEIMRPTWRDKPDGTYDFLGQVQLAVEVLPPTTTPDQAIKDALRQIAVVEDSQISDADPLAGQPTRHAAVDAEVQGMQVAADSYAFSTPSATYVVSFVALPPTGAAARALYPQVLPTITVDPAP
jgi:pimeloyl-ACP methyl ester carboxylesterase